MSVRNVTPIKPDTYTVTVQHKPATPNDIAPWYVSVEDGARYVGGGWRPTRDDALKRAREVIAADAMLGKPETLTLNANGELVRGDG